MQAVDKGEKGAPSSTVADINVVESQNINPTHSWLSKVAAWGVELRGITPVPFEEKTDTRYINVFFVWFTMSTNLLP